MKTIARRGIGFLMVTIPVVTWLHLAKSNAPVEIVDDIVSGAFFTAAFVLGSCVAHFGAGASERTSGALRQLFVGAGAGLVVWSVIISGWVLIPEPLQRDLAGHAFVTNTVVVFAGGLLATRAAWMFTRPLAARR